MGTNYYIGDPSKEVKHIGKRSAVGGGNCKFTFATELFDDVDGPTVKDKFEYIRYLYHHKDNLYDEYGNKISYSEFFKEIENDVIAFLDGEFC